MTKIDTDSDWVLRLDADEYFTSKLVTEINKCLVDIPINYNGVYFGRRIYFQGSPIKYGGLFPAQVLRLFRYGKGRCENRWMDEHIIVSGSTINFKGELIDDNLNNLSWWTEKHNNYSSREAVELLNLEHHFMPIESIGPLGASQIAFKRWIKENIYFHFPVGLRAATYFFYRYIIRFGFLDGKNGASFHFLQGFWYRYLVDLKVIEVRKYMRVNNTSIKNAIFKVLGIEV